MPYLGREPYGDYTIEYTNTPDGNVRFSIRDGATLRIVRKFMASAPYNLGLEHAKKIIDTDLRDIDGVDIWTDGGATPNPGAGGWGVVMKHRGTGFTKELSGGKAGVTNNEMELTAALEALKALTRPCKVRLHTDSQWLIGAMNGNKRKSHRAALQEIDALCRTHEVEWCYVAGHTGDEHNERAHRLADNAKPS